MNAWPLSLKHGDVEVDDPYDFASRLRFVAASALASLVVASRVLGSAACLAAVANNTVHVRVVVHHQLE